MEKKQAREKLGSLSPLVRGNREPMELGTPHYQSEEYA